MATLLKTIAILTFLVFSSTGCIPHRMAIPSSSQANLNDTIIDIANQLKQSTILKDEDKSTIAVTTFVDLNKFDKTTPFGRILGESMISELFVRGFNVADFRGQGAISISNDGEFYITRDISKLKNEVSNTYVLVGTYTKIEKDILINVRIIDNTTGKVISSARSIYNNNYCALDNKMCSKKSISIKRKIKIVND